MNRQFSTTENPNVLLGGIIYFHDLHCTFMQFAFSSGCCSRIAVVVSGAGPESVVGQCILCSIFTLCDAGGHLWLALTPHS